MKPSDEELEGISGYIDDFVQAIGDAGLKLPYKHEELFNDGTKPVADTGTQEVLPSHEL